MFTTNMSDHDARIAELALRLYAGNRLDIATLVSLVEEPVSKAKLESGYVLFEDARIVVIATTESANSKTGDMIQIWILSRAVNPVEAVRTGADADCCIDCKLRGTGNRDRMCYVSVFQAPLSIWNKYNRGGYSRLAIADYGRVFGGRKVRFGAYGEPVLIPLHIVREIGYACDGHTGYTHQWSNPAYAEYQVYFMASVDTVAEYDAAKKLGWRTFRVRTADGDLLPREIMCPASDEAGHRTTCSECRLCAGSYAGDPRKDIAIIVHGGNAGKFIQIGGAR